MVSESAGRNESERRGSLEMDKSRRPRRWVYAEGSMAGRSLAEAVRHSGGVVAAAR